MSDRNSHRQRGPGPQRAASSTTGAAAFAALWLALALAGCGGSNTDRAPALGQPDVVVLSSRPELVSGGDALLRVTLPSGVAPADVTILAAGRDMSSRFTQTEPGTLIGRVDGLAAGDNTIEVTSPSGKAAARSMTVRNFPATGPMISGPHLQPFVCQTQDFTLPDGSKLGAATDANCSAPTRITYLYRPAAGGALLPLPGTGALPSDVATTTTTTGAVVPFVVRVETGTMNRGIYQNAILHDPTSDPPPTATTAPKGWNRRLIAQHGSGCPGGWYVQGAALGVSLLTGDNLTRLGEGYALFENTLNHPTNSCNAQLAGETTMMGKEHFIETFGVPLFTVSTGGSGGAYTSLQVADAFPGLIDGVLISSTFPDALSIALSGLDARLLTNYYLAGGNTAGLTEAQMVAVSGHKGLRAWYDLALQAGRTDPVPGRSDPIPTDPLIGGYRSAVWNDAVAPGLRYDPVSNPTGARPTIFDVARNVYGVDPATGFALRPFDNVGVQYGLAALNAGTISVAQFIDLNQRVGGYDQDAGFVAQRSTGAAGAIRRAYQSGIHLGGGGGLAAIPVFDISGLYDDDRFYHYQWFHFAVRERMREANGDADNHVMWRGGLPITELFAPPPAEGAALAQAVNTRSWATFIEWMDAYTADASARSTREKAVANKPAAAVDGCFTRALSPQFIAEPQTRSAQPDSQCNTLWPSYSAPRIEAGGPLAANKLKCQLKPVDADDYAVPLSGPEIAQLRAIFPSGVCDWGSDGIEQTDVVPWASFGPSPTNLVFDVTAP